MGYESVRCPACGAASGVTLLDNSRCKYKCSFCGVVFEKKQPDTTSNSLDLQTIEERAYIYLEDGFASKARNLFEEITCRSPRYYRGYLGLLLTSSGKLDLRSDRDLYSDKLARFILRDSGMLDGEFSKEACEAAVKKWGSNELARAIEFARSNPQENEYMTSLVEQLLQKVESLFLDEKYAYAKEWMQKNLQRIEQTRSLREYVFEIGCVQGDSDDSYKGRQLLSELGTYRDASRLLAEFDLREQNHLDKLKQEQLQQEKESSERQASEAYRLRMKLKAQKRENRRIAIYHVCRVLWIFLLFGGFGFGFVYGYRGFFNAWLLGLMYILIGSTFIMIWHDSGKAVMTSLAIEFISLFPFSDVLVAQRIHMLKGVGLLALIYIVTDIICWFLGYILFQHVSKY